MNYIIKMTICKDCNISHLPVCSLRRSESFLRPLSYGVIMILFKSSVEMLIIFIDSLILFIVYGYSPRIIYSPPCVLEITDPVIYSVRFPQMFAFPHAAQCERVLSLWCSPCFLRLSDAKYVNEVIYTGKYPSTF